MPVICELYGDAPLASGRCCRKSIDVLVFNRQQIRCVTDSDVAPGHLDIDLPEVRDPVLSYFNPDDISAGIVNENAARARLVVFCRSALVGPKASVGWRLENVDQNKFLSRTVGYA